MYEALFNFLSFSPGPFWILIFFWPTNNKLMTLVDYYLFLLAGIFAVGVVPLVPELFPVLMQPTFSAIKAFLSTDSGVVGTWNHMILADLWIGRWVSQDAVRHGVTAWIRIPLVATILLFGPLGVFCYLTYKLVFRRNIALINYT